MTRAPAKHRVGAARAAERQFTADMTCAEAFSVAARGCLDDIAARHDATCQGDADALHQTRIALTRLRSLVAFFPSMAKQPRWVRLRSELRWLNRYLGSARDMDVVMAASGAKKGAGTETSDKAADKAWAASHRRLERALRSQRYRRLVADLSRWIEQGQTAKAADEPVSDHAARKLARWHKRLLKRSHNIATLDLDELHKLRLRTKRFRYALEFCEGLSTGKQRGRHQAMLKHLRKAQAALGHLNDMENRRALSASPQDAESIHQSKRARRLMAEADAAYRKLAEIRPFWA
jgi:CHAD domain-containing protein